MTEHEAIEQVGKPLTYGRGYSWPPFEKGNEAEAEFERLISLIEIEDVSFLKRPSFVIALEALAEALGRARVLRKHLWAEHGEDGSCERETCIKTLAEFERLVDRRMDSTGFNPTTRARIERDLSSAGRDRVGIAAQLSDLERRDDTGKGAQ